MTRILTIQASQSVARVAERRSATQRQPERRLIRFLSSELVANAR